MAEKLPLLALALSPRIPEREDPSLPDDFFHIELLLLGEINALSAATLCRQLRRYADQGATTIDLRITSGGGSLAYGLLIFDTIQEIKARPKITVRTMVEGSAASAATLVSLSASDNQRFMHSSSQMLLHNARAILSAPVGLKQEDLKVHLANMKQLEDKAKQIYTDKTKLKGSALDKALEKDDWFSSGKCEELGLVDAVGAFPKPERPAQEEPKQRQEQQVFVLQRGDPQLSEEDLLKRLFRQFPKFQKGT